MTPKTLLASLRSGGEVSRARIYHDAPDPSATDRLTDSHYERAGAALDCPPAAIRALAIVESAEKPLVDGRPVIRFEAHKWRQFRRARGDALVFDRARNPSRQPERWAQFEAMHAIDPAAAILSHSWGAFQIMGFNHRMCGYESPDAFASAMHDVSKQVRALVAFVRAQSRLHEGLKARDARLVAYHYNGPQYRRNSYHEKWESALYA